MYKRQKIGSTTTTTDYCGNVIYENGTQKLLLTEEGYINPVSYTHLKAVSNMLNNDDNRTFAHERGHSVGLGHTMNVENLMTQKKVIQDFDEIILKQLS